MPTGGATNSATPTEPVNLALHLLAESFLLVHAYEIFCVALLILNTSKISLDSK